MNQRAQELHLGIGLVALGGAGAGVVHPSKTVQQRVPIRWHRAPHAAANRRTADVPEPALDPRYDTTPTPSGGESIPEEFTNWTGLTDGSGPAGEPLVPAWAREEWLAALMAAFGWPTFEAPPIDLALGSSPISFGWKNNEEWIHFQAPGLGTYTQNTGLCAGWCPAPEWRYFPNGPLRPGDGRDASRPGYRLRGHALVQLARLDGRPVR
jgi:hypothetical protein